VLCAQQMGVSVINTVSARGVVVQLGLLTPRDDDAVLVERLLAAMHATGADFTGTFRCGACRRATCAVCSCRVYTTAAPRVVVCAGPWLASRRRMWTETALTCSGAS
jgi:glycine/D-amino acid oxidase-like deaminating enzyme